MKEIKASFATKALTTNWQTLISLAPADTNGKAIKAIFAVFGAGKYSYSPFTLNFRLTDDPYANTPLCIWESGDVVFTNQDDEHHITTIPECFFLGFWPLCLQAKVVSGDNDNLSYDCFIYDVLADLDIYSYRGSALQTADDIADKVLKTPANLLATDANGAASVNVGDTNVSGTLGNWLKKLMGKR